MDDEPQAGQGTQLATQTEDAEHDLEKVSGQGSQQVADQSQESVSAAPAPASPPAGCYQQYYSAKVYASYLDHLRKGGHSGISGSFGSAIDLLCDATEPPQPPCLDVTDLEPRSAEEIEKRMVHLVDLVCAHSYKFMQEYLFKCDNGKYGPKAQRQLGAPVSEATIRSILKELSCGHLCIAALEQFKEGTSPEWLRQFLFAAIISGTKEIATQPTADEILEGYDELSVARVSLAATTNLCQRWKLPDLGHPAWNDLYDFLRNSGELRYALLQAALTKTI